MARPPRGQQPDSSRGLIAAAKRLPTVVTPGAAAPKLRRREWQSDAWDFFDNVGEVKHAVRYVGNQMAKLRLFPAVANPDPDGDPIPVTDETSGVPAAVAAAAAVELARLRSPRGGQAEILKQLAMNLEVAGEGFIVGYAARDVTMKVNGADVTVTEPEEWEIRSVSEVEGKAGAYKIIDPEAEGTEGRDGRKLTENDTVIRVWQRHPRWANSPDCALGGLLVDCEALHTLSLLVIGDSNSKRNNGFLLVPNEITFGSAREVDGDEVDGEDDDDKVMRALSDTMQGPIADPQSASAVQPTLVRGPAAALKEFRHVLATRPADTIDDKIEGRVKRLARGLDLPVEVVLGLDSTTFANAGQVDQDTFDDYLEPRSVMMVDALSFGFLAPQLAENTVTAEWADRIFVWYDASSLLTDVDPVQTAPKAHRALVISDAKLRDVLGFTEEDAPTEEELLRRVGMQRGVTGDVTLALLKLLGVDIPVDTPANLTPAGGTMPPGANPAPAAVASGGRASPRARRPVGGSGQGGSPPVRRPPPFDRR